MLLKNEQTGRSSAIEDREAPPSSTLTDTRPCSPLPLKAEPSTPVSSSWYFRSKGSVELAVTLLLLLLATPIILICALLVRLTSRGPAFYSQVRLGKDGLPFHIYKIRTMRQDAEDGGACWSKPGDSRITFIGRILRRTHLDELPQLWNVLRGDMSLVGPRPERPEFVPSLERAIPCYRDRLLIRPGVTGLAQVQLPADTDLSSVRRKLAYDLYYVHQLNLWLDFRLVLSTGLHMFGVPYWILSILFRIPRQDHVEAAYLARIRTAQSTPRA